MRPFTQWLRVSPDVGDLLFRVLFSLIFVGLGLEHLLDDHLIQALMPEWLPFKRPLSIGAGLVLLAGGLSLMLGFRIHLGATVLAFFLIAVTLVIHVPALFHRPPGLPTDWGWLWDVFQRSNLFKNLCLLGGCIHLVDHEVGRFSLDGRARRAAR